MFELLKSGAPRRTWTVHTRIVVVMSLLLLVGGTAAFLLFEWTNQRTLGDFNPSTKLLAASFMSVSARTAGFNTIDIGALTEESWLMTNILMFIMADPPARRAGSR